LEIKGSSRRIRVLSLIGIALVGLSILVSWLEVLPPLFSFDLAGLLAAIFGGLPLFRKAYLGLKNRSVTAELAMTIGMVAALSIGEFLSAAIIAFFALIAEFLEEFTINESRSAIRRLIEISPKKAIIKRNNVEIEADIGEVKKGDIVIVKSGERIPVDGVVVDGQAYINQAPITGESMIIERGVGDTVFTGTINELGLIQVKATKIGADTTLSHIINLVEEAEFSKAPIQKTADRFATYFLPLVLILGLSTFILTGDVNSSIAVVVVACPCAVVLSTPLAIIASVGKAAKKGIIIKGGLYLEELGRVDTVIMDKTGTLTKGKPEVTEIKCFDTHSEKEVLTLASIAEEHSEHPLARAVLERAEAYGINIPRHRECQVIRGKGVIAVYGDQTLTVGNRELLMDKGIAIPTDVEDHLIHEEKNGKTVMLVAHDDRICGVISVADTLREDAVRAVKELKDRGLRLIMLTGDNIRVASGIAKQAGINEVFAGMLPEEKVDVVKKLMEDGKKVVMVGDGINDAPALAQASVGIAMGTMGADVAIEAADVALMTDNLMKISEAIKIGDLALKVIKQNIAASIVFNVLGVTLASLGILNPTLAAVAHTVPDFFLFLNSSRLILG